VSTMDMLTVELEKIDVDTTGHRDATGAPRAASPEPLTIFEAINRVPENAAATEAALLAAEQLFGGRSRELISAEAMAGGRGRKLIDATHTGAVLEPSTRSNSKSSSTNRSSSSLQESSELDPHARRGSSFGAP